MKRHIARILIYWGSFLIPYTILFAILRLYGADRHAWVVPISALVFGILHGITMIHYGFKPNGKDF